MLGTWQKHDRNIIRSVQMSYKEPATEPSQILKMKNVSMLVSRHYGRI